MREDIAGPQGASSRPMWETLEGMVREKAQEFIQQIMEEEVTELLGREKSERRSTVDSAEGYRNGYGKPRRLAMSSGTVTPWTDNKSEHETRKSRIDPRTNRPTFAREHPAMGNHGCERDGLPCRRSAKGRTRRSQVTCRTAPAQIQRSGSEGDTGAPQVQMLSTGPGSEGFPVKRTTHSWTPALVFARASFAPRGRSGDRSLRISVAPC